MNTLLSFMDKIYSDSKTLSIIYVVGSILLFIFIVLLVVSLRKPEKKEETKIIEEPKIDEEPKEESVVEEKKEEIKEEETIEKEKSIDQSIFEKTVIIPINELEKESKEDNIQKALDIVEEVKDEPKEEKEDMNNISAEIPDVDDYVDNIVKKTYEKNEQFSSVYVGNNTSTIKLDKVMENLNVDETVKENIIPEEEKTVEPEVEEETKLAENAQESVEKEVVKIQEPTKENSLDALKKALDEKKKELNSKQDDLKAKLESLKNNNN